MREIYKTVWIMSTLPGSCQNVNTAFGIVWTTPDQAFGVGGKLGASLVATWATPDELSTVSSARMIV